MNNRKAATDLLLKYVDKIVPGGENRKIWEERLKSLSDKAFDEFIARLESGEEIIDVVSPNFNDNKVTIENNLAIAKELGHEFFQKLWLTDAQTGDTYLTPIPYMVIDLPIRRQIQVLVKKSSIAEDSAKVDELTGQRATSVKGSGLSMPQIQSLYAHGLDKAIEELLKYRGGDEKGLRALDTTLVKQGSASMQEISPLAGKVKSTQTLSTFLKGMHIQNTL